MISGNQFQSTGSPLNRSIEDGIDPAFDGDMEELERQFAEYRITLDHN